MLAVHRGPDLGCHFHGEMPFGQCPCVAFSPPDPPAEHEPVTRDQFFADAERALRASFPDRWQSLMHALEIGWPRPRP